jgi:hypothetical protein
MRRRKISSSKKSRYVMMVRVWKRGRGKETRHSTGKNTEGVEIVVPRTPMLISVILRSFNSVSSDLHDAHPFLFHVLHKFGSATHLDGEIPQVSCLGLTSAATN